MAPDDKPVTNPDSKIDLGSTTPDQIARDLARDELKSKQQLESEKAARDLQNKKSEITSSAAIKRAEVLGEVTPTPDTTPKIETTSLSPDTSVKSPEPTTLTPVETPPLAPATPPATTTETPPEKKGTMDQIKEFFTKMWGPIGALLGSIGDKLKDWFSKIFNSKDAVYVPTSNSPSASSTFSAIEKSNSNESWQSTISAEAKRLGIQEAFAKAIVNVEAGKSGLNPDGTLKIRFEAHVFNNQLSQRGIKEKHGAWGSSTLNGRNVDGVSCEGGQGNEHACFKKAMEINKEAALNSISMGLGQIMGFNASASGYSSAEEMFNRFSGTAGGEPEQIRAMFRLIEKSPGMLSAARSCDFNRFSAAYNGAKIGTPKNADYSSKLMAAYQSNGGSSGSVISGTAVV